VFASVQSLIPPEQLYGPRLDDMLTCAKSLRNLTSYECDIDDPKIRELAVDYLCRYSIAKTIRYGPNRGQKEQVLKKCYCCGYIYEYIEYGKVCTGYCDAGEGDQRKVGVDPIINLPFNWGDNCPEAKFDGDGNKVDLEPCLSLSDVLKENAKNPTNNEPLIRTTSTKAPSTEKTTTRSFLKQPSRKTTTIHTTISTRPKKITTRRTTTPPSTRTTTTQRIRTTTTARTTTTIRTTTTARTKTTTTTTSTTTTKRVKKTTIHQRSLNKKTKKTPVTSSSVEDQPVWSVTASQSEASDFKPKKTTLEDSDIPVWT